MMFDVILLPKSDNLLNDSGCTSTKEVHHTCQESCSSLQVRVRLVLLNICWFWGPCLPPVCLGGHGMLCCTACLRLLNSVAGVFGTHVITHITCTFTVQHSCNIAMAVGGHSLYCTTVSIALTWARTRNMSIESVSNPKQVDHCSKLWMKMQSAGQ